MYVFIASATYKKILGFSLFVVQSVRNISIKVETSIGLFLSVCWSHRIIFAVIIQLKGFNVYCMIRGQKGNVIAFWSYMKFNNFAF